METKKDKDSNEKRDKEKKEKDKRPNGMAVLGIPSSSLFFFPFSRHLPYFFRLLILNNKCFFDVLSRSPESMERFTSFGEGLE